jgi:hypothetical protein
MFSAPARRGWGGGGGEGGGRFFQSKAINEVDAGRDRATPASVRHDDDEEMGQGLGLVIYFYHMIVCAH